MPDELEADERRRPADLTPAGFAALLDSLRTVAALPASTNRDKRYRRRLRRTLEALEADDKR